MEERKGAANAPPRCFKCGKTLPFDLIRPDQDAPGQLVNVTVDGTAFEHVYGCWGCLARLRALGGIQVEAVN